MPPGAARSVLLPGLQTRDRRAWAARIAAVAALPLLEALIFVGLAIRLPAALPLLGPGALLLVVATLAIVIPWSRAAAAGRIAIVQDRGEVGIAGRMLAFAELDEATQLTDGINGEVIVGLRLGVREGRNAVIVLRRDDRPTLTPGESRALLDLIAESSIRLPVDPYDPTGKFADSSFPDHLDKDAAMALVERMSAPAGDPA